MRRKKAKSNAVAITMRTATMATEMPATLPKVAHAGDCTTAKRFCRGLDGGRATTAVPTELKSTAYNTRAAIATRPIQIGHESTSRNGTETRANARIAS